MNGKYEKLIALVLMGIVTVVTILILFKTTEPELPVTKEQDNTKLELEIENQKLKNLIDSLILVDSLHLALLKEKQILIKTKKDEVIKAIYFIPNADTKYKDSLWTVYTQDTIGRGYIK
jgi:hypothetical protein